MDEQPQKISSGWWTTGVVAGLIVIALLVMAYAIGYDKGKHKGEGRPATAGAAKPTNTTPSAPAAATGPGKEIFASKCGSCHTLSAAGTNGGVGPNLDQLKPDAKRVEAAIANGGTGGGVMPKGLVSGDQAKQVAAFVAQSAGG
jgi:mono/diheme cytochrome c family protein